jgi:DNA-binding transcriptional MerR regulator
MSAEPARAYVGIGEVLDLLRPEFPDVTVSKIRFLEKEGLIQPARSPSQYRKYTTADVDRLRYILTVQRDQYLPLRVIKNHLDGQDEDAPPPPAGQPAGPVLAGLPAGPIPTAPLTRRDLLAATGLDEDRLAELEDFGLVRRNGRHYGPEALAAAQAVVALDRHGVQARHLRVLRASVERETALIEQVVAPMLRQRSPGARDRAGRTAREIAAITLRLHAALIEAALADAGFGDRPPGDV